jgi:thioester reductase-like protein
MTGASGVVGAALLPELQDDEVICLVHRGRVADGYEVVRADVTQPGLGLDAAAYADLADRTDVVVHCAAITDWAAPRERIRQTNVDGTAKVAELARDANAPVYQMSTSFIQAIRPDTELELPAEHVIVNYVTSKLDSEKVLRDSGVPHTVFRPTNLIGDSRTGEIAKNQSVQLVAEFMCRGKVPLFPTRPGTLVDALPQDLFAKAVAAVIQAEEVGVDYWLTYGPDALPVARAVELCAEFMERIGQPIPRPRLVDSDRLDEVREDIAALPPMSRAFFARLVEFSDGMTACGVFPTDLPALRNRFSLPDIDPAEAYVRGLEYLTRSKRIWQPATA